MILIFSQNDDYSTNEIIKWLISYKKPYIRVHEDEVFDVRILKKRILLKSDRNDFYIDEIDSVWYRRGGLKLLRLEYMNASINTHMMETQHWIADYIIKTLESKKHINKISSSIINKLVVLEIAEKVGLQVPQYYLSDNTDDVVLNKTIIKSIAGNAILYNFEKETDAAIYTSIVSVKEKEPFFITFFQEYIEKDFEIRTFYLNGKCWSTAIISQNDKKTQIDHRHYNHSKPNRNVPYNLPNILEEKIKILMEKLDLNCGSIDLLKKGEEFYFLEINPIGQFTGHSNICNYNLENIIADYL
ncbi:grasp-with-spasm system ATP-grasp peptide maturase [Weeksellaceae bacterium A-14]